MPGGRRGRPRFRRGGGRYLRRRANVVGLERLASDVGLTRDLFFNTIQEFPETQRVRFAGAYVTGQGTVISKNGVLIRDSAAEFLAHGQVPDGLRGKGGESFELVAQPSRHVQVPSLLVKRPWWRNYGHWLIDGATLLALASSIRMPPEWQVVVGAHEHASMRRVMLETINSALPNARVHVHPDHETWTFSELHYITPVHVPPLFKLPVALAALRALFLHGLPQAGGGRRLYVQSGAEGKRTLENEEELLSICLQRGFEIVRPEEYGIKEQAQMFLEADAVVGVKGAGLTNVVFSTSSTKLLVLSPADLPDPFYWDLAGQLGIDYAEIFGDLISRTSPQGQNPYRIDRQQVAWVLDEMLRH